MTPQQTSSLQESSSRPPASGIPMRPQTAAVEITAQLAQEPKAAQLPAAPGIWEWEPNEETPAPGRTYATVACGNPYSPPGIAQARQRARQAGSGSSQPSTAADKSMEYLQAFINASISNGSSNGHSKGVSSNNINSGSTLDVSSGCNVSDAKCREAGGSEVASSSPSYLQAAQMGGGRGQGSIQQGSKKMSMEGIGRHNIGRDTIWP